MAVTEIEPYDRGESPPRVPAQVSPGTRRKIFPWMVLRICRELAEARQSQAQIAAAWGVAPSTMCEFAQRHVETIDQIRRDLDNEYAGLWVADKRERLAAYQRDLEVIEGSPQRSHHEWLKTRATILKNVAEELGETGSGSPVVNIAVIGVDADAYLT